ncbi:MAG: hypothetical protein IJ316_02065 [Clostridia bacterium]|nr:hypothetical protein [Clostridia bacterium]
MFTNTMMGHLHCPQCKATTISPVTESSVNGAFTTGRGHMAATTVSNTHRNYWMCSTCGTKFRNIQNLEEEIAKTKKNPIICAVVAVIAAILCIDCVFKIIGNPFLIFFAGSFAFVCAITAIVCLCFVFVYNGRLKKMKNELEYLKFNCFN